MSSRSPGRVLVAALCCAWTVPVCCHLLGIDLVLLPLLILGTASLLRGGHTLLDRVVLAVGLLFCATAASGLVLSFWPWGLHPVAMAGTGLSALVVLATATGRTPRLPKPHVSDAVLVAAAAAAAGVVAWPFLRRDFSGRLALIDYRDDFARQLSLFDTIRAIGGYVFLHDSDPRVLAAVPPPMLRYPQGSHFVYAVVDNFVRSSTAPGSTTSLVDHYIGYSVLGFFLMTLTGTWAVRWIAGHRLSGGRYLVPVTVFAGYCGCAEPVFEFICGHTSATVGIALVIILVGVLSRPLASTPDQVIVICALFAGVGFTYYLYLPAAGLAALGWCYAYRHRVRQIWPLALSCAGAATLLAPIVPSYGLRVGQAAALRDASSLIYSREFLVAMMLLAGAGLVSPIGRRLPVWRGYAWSTGCITAQALATATYQYARYGNAGYYFDKLLWLLILVVLIGLGSLSTLLPLPGPTTPAAIRARICGALPTLLVTAAVVALLGPVRGDSPYRPFGTTTFGRWFATGGCATPRPAWNIQHTLAAIGDPQGSPTMIISGTHIETYLSSLYLATMLRGLGTSNKSVISAFQLQKITPVALMESTASLPRPLLVATPDHDTAAALNELRQRRPDLNFVVYLI